MPLLDSRFIQKNIAAVGNTCTVTVVEEDTATDSYRLVSETTTDYEDVDCFVHVLSFEDVSVRQGEAREGDLSFWFDYSRDSILSQGNRITWNGDTYQIIDVQPFQAERDTLMLLECRVAQI